MKADPHTTISNEHSSAITAAIRPVKEDGSIGGIIDGVIHQFIPEGLFDDEPA